MKHPRFATALLLAALAGGPMLAEDAPEVPAPDAAAREAQIQVEVQAEVQNEAQPAPVRLHAQRIVINAPDGVDPQAGNGQVVVVRVISIDEHGNAVVLDENGNVVEQGPEAGVWVELQNNNDVPRANPQQLPVQPADMIEATYLGVQTEPLDFESADLLLLPHGTGLNVLGVPADSPAAAAGLKAGDVILKLNDQVLVNTAQLAVLIRTRDAGEKVTLTVLRNGEELKLIAELGKATVPALGPGGEPMQRGWQVQPMPIERPGAGLEAAPFEQFDLQDHMADIERKIQQQQEQLLRMIAEIEGEELDIREQHERLRQELRERVEEQRRLQPGPNVQAQRAMNFGDGQHNIAVTGDGEGWQTLKVTDRDGQVIYDGQFPQTDEQWQEVPEAVRDKARAMMKHNGFELHLRQIEQGIRPEPAQPQEQPEPQQLPQA